MVKRGRTGSRKLSDVLENSQTANTCRTPSALRTRNASRAANSRQAAGPSKAANTSRAVGASKFTHSPSPRPIEIRAAGPSCQPDNAPRHEQEVANPLESGGQVASLVQEFIELIQQVQQMVQQGSRSGQTSRSILDFKELAPPAFEGSTDPVESLNWLETMEKAFDGMKCTDQEKVRFAVYQLQQEAYQWWKTVERYKEADQPITWGFFRQEFLDMYFPESVQFEKEIEFMELTQGNMTVAQYDDKFIELSRFAPDLIPTDSIRARIFERGLRPRIRLGVRPMQLNSYQEVVNVAKIVEQEANNIQ